MEGGRLPGCGFEVEQVIWDRLRSLLEHSEFKDGEHCSWVGRGTVAKNCLLRFPFLNSSGDGCAIFNCL